MVNQLTLLKLGALILVITLTSCGRIPHFLADKNDFTLRKVECTKENGVSIVQEFTENTQSYSDSLFKIKFMIHPTGMQFKIQNNHNGQIKINWNESTLKSNLTQLDGKVIHYGIKFIQSSDFLPLQ
ncbi:MAG: hypothetical protein IPI50_14925 [Saprospiraceae bacterium]|nr:hypothetical protein [Saprospiraceae bacterium]